MKLGDILIYGTMHPVLYSILDMKQKLFDRAISTHLYNDMWHSFELSVHKPYNIHWAIVANLSGGNSKC